MAPLCWQPSLLELLLKLNSYLCILCLCYFVLYVTVAVLYKSFKQDSALQAEESCLCLCNEKVS